MSPWKLNNPFANSEPEDEEQKKKKAVPDTIVEVICEGNCHKPINIRIQEKHRLRGSRTIQCHNCLHIIEVFVFPGGQVTVYQSNRDGSNRKQTPYEKVWQDQHG